MKSISPFDQDRNFWSFYLVTMTILIGFAIWIPSVLPEQKIDFVPMGDYDINEIRDNLRRLNSFHDEEPEETTELLNITGVLNTTLGDLRFDNDYNYLTILPDLTYSPTLPSIIFECKGGELDSLNPQITINTPTRNTTMSFKEFCRRNS